MPLFTVTGCTCCGPCSALRCTDGRFAPSVTATADWPIDGDLQLEAETLDLAGGLEGEYWTASRSQFNPSSVPYTIPSAPLFTWSGGQFPPLPSTGLASESRTVSLDLPPDSVQVAVQCANTLLRLGYRSVATNVTVEAAVCSGWLLRLDAGLARASVWRIAWFTAGEFETANTVLSPGWPLYPGFASAYTGSGPSVTSTDPSPGRRTVITTNKAGCWVLTAFGGALPAVTVSYGSVPWGSTMPTSSGWTFLRELVGGGGYVRDYVVLSGGCSAGALLAQFAGSGCPPTSSTVSTFSTTWTITRECGGPIIRRASVPSTDSAVWTADMTLPTADAIPWTADATTPTADSTTWLAGGELLLEAPTAPRPAAATGTPAPRCRRRSPDPHTVQDGTGRLAFTCHKPGFERFGLDVFECVTCSDPGRRCGSGRCDGYDPADPEED